MIQISVQGKVANRNQWMDLATKVERQGFHGLYVADHRGSTASPFVALAAAATLTERITLGTCVLNAGAWSPMALATEAVTLDALSDGRCLLGVGAGHTPAEWSMVGSSIPAASERVDRMIELVVAVRALIAGEQVTTSNKHFALSSAQLTDFPVKRKVPILIGGNGRRVLSFAARESDFIGVTGLGRTLADGHSHEVNWSLNELNRTFDRLASVARDAGNAPEIEALVQHIEITDDAERTAAQMAEFVPGASADVLLNAPFMWIGTAKEISTQINQHAEAWGITRCVIRDSAIAAGSEVLHSLQSS